MSDSSKNSQATEEAGLRIVGDSSLEILPKGASPALEEMVSRSLAKIQANTASGLSQRGGELVAPLKAGDEREFEIVPGVKIVMCWIPPGDFLMGSLDDDLAPSLSKLDRVKITQGFWLAKTQTTQAQWRAVMGANPSQFKGDDRPVEMVSWNDICGDESRMGGFIGKLNQSSPADGKFDLPTEAQWEYACLAGTTGPYVGDLNEIAWYRENSGHVTHSVGLKKANGWGLHDMHGNVYEWCADWCGCYDVNAALDPTGTLSGKNRVLRGGCFITSAVCCRVADRFSFVPHLAHGGFGFRIARSYHPEAKEIKKIQQKK